MDSRSALIALNMVPGIASVRINKLIGKFGSPEAVFDAPAKQIMEINGIGNEIARNITYFHDMYSVENEMKECDDKRIRIMTIYDDDYPTLLRNIYDPPPVLYCLGEFEKWPANSLNIGVVGTRISSDYGERVCKKIIGGMKQTKLCFTVVSGMARGIDTIAHTEAIKENIYTAAVLGFGLNHIWPLKYYHPAEEISKAGVLISEYPLNMMGNKQNFPRRNRIISGLSEGVLVVEAGERSGALITANFALEQGRYVFAVPGSIFADKSAGSNTLLKQGAKPVMSIYDITEEFELLSGPKEKNAQQSLSLINLNDEEKRIYELLDFEKKHIDNIAIESNIEIIKLASMLTILEMKGAVKQLSGKNFVRAV
jgi:DNA processing protein